MKTFVPKRFDALLLCIAGYCVSVFSFQPVLSAHSVFDAQDQRRDSTKKASPNLFDPVVVTGTRFQQQKSQIPASITVVEREEIERSGAMNVLTVLANHVPGLFLNTRGTAGFGVGPGSAGVMSMRGLSGNTQTLMLIDGQPQFMGIFGHPINDSYMSSDVERVEVIRGSASVLYGSNAFGGVINLVTREPQPGLKVAGTAAYGMFSTGRANLTGTYRQDRFKTMISVNHERTGGIRTSTDARGTVVDDAFTNTSGYAKLGYTLTDNLSLVADGSVNVGYFSNPGPIAPSTVTENRFARDYTRGRAALSFENRFEPVEGALRFYYNFGNHSFGDGFRSNDFTRGLTFYQNLKLLPDNTITLGVDVRNFGGRASNINVTTGTVIGYDTDLSVTETDVYAIIQQKLAGIINLSAGARLINSSFYGREFVPSVGASLQATENTTIKASAGRGVRSPAVVDMFLFLPPNANLVPEHLWNYELSIAQVFPESRMRLELTGYTMDVSNLIQVVPPPPPPPQRRNVGSSRNWGIEFAGTWYASENLDFALAYQYLNSQQIVLYAPMHNLNIQARYTLGPATLMINARYIGRLNLTVREPVRSVDFTLLNARLNMQVLPNVQVFVEGNNLLNTQYQTDLNYPQPSINAMIGAHFYFTAQPY
jgi:iron complex outermembrane receptor protein